MGNIIKKFDEFSLNEKKKTSGISDEDKYLSAAQKKLPEGLKKGIIAKMKKSGGKPKDEKEKDDKEKVEKEEPKSKKGGANKSDEAKYLTPAQRKLPEGLKKGIIAKKKAGK